MRRQCINRVANAPNILEYNYTFVLRHFYTLAVERTLHFGRSVGVARWFEKSI